MSTEMFLHPNNRSGNSGPAECHAWDCPNLFQSLLFHWEWLSGYLFTQRKSGPGWGRARCVGSWVNRISGP